MYILRCAGGIKSPVLRFAVTFGISGKIPGESPKLQDGKCSRVQFSWTKEGWCEHAP